MGDGYYTIRDDIDSPKVKEQLKLVFEKQRLEEQILELKKRVQEIEKRIEELEEEDG
jgi:predicted nuclease with TOPRIM domain